MKTEINGKENNQDVKVMEKATKFFYKMKELEKNDGELRISMSGKDLLIFVYYLDSEDRTDYKGKSSLEIIEMISNTASDNEKEITAMTSAFLKENVDIDFQIDMYDYNNKKVGILGVSCLDFSYITIVMKNCNIFHPSFVEESDVKYYYSVACTAECSDTGFLLLTKKEAAFLNHCTNPNNWELLQKEDYSGFFAIDIANPYPFYADMNDLKNSLK